MRKFLTAALVAAAALAGQQALAAEQFGEVKSISATELVLKSGETFTIPSTVQADPEIQMDSSVNVMYEMKDGHRVVTEIILEDPDRR